MSYRPTSITVIGYFLLGLGILGFIGYSLALVLNYEAAQEVMAENTLPIPLQHAMSLGGAVISVLSGYYLLHGRNWARYLYVMWTVLAFLIGLTTSPMSLTLIPGAIVFFVITFFLFRPAANAFFACDGDNIEPGSIPSTRRVLSIIFYIVAGFFFACTGAGALMSFEAGIVKTMMLCFQMLPFAVCLAIGRLLSPGPGWKRDVGVVFIAAALAGALMAVMMAVTFANPEFQEANKLNQAELFSDYLFASVWFISWVLLGGALLLMSRKSPRGVWEDQQVPRLVDR